MKRELKWHKTREKGRYNYLKQFKRSVAPEIYAREEIY